MRGTYGVGETGAVYPERETLTSLGGVTGRYLSCEKGTSRTSRKSKVGYRGGAPELGSTDDTQRETTRTGTD